VIKKYIIIILVTSSLLSLRNAQAQGEHLDTNSNQPGDTIAGRVEKGMEQLQSNDLSAALDTFKSILDQQPDNPEANYRIGVIYMRQNQYKLGIEHLKRAAQYAPDNISYHMSLANAYEFSRQNELAIQQYKKVNEMASPDSNEANEAKKKIDFLRATQYATEGNVDEALPIFEKLAKGYPDDTLIQYSLGLAYLFVKDLEKSKSIFTNLIQLAPDNLNIYLNLATIYEQQGNLKQATENLRKVIEISPRGRLAQQARERLGIIEGRLLMQEGNLSEALDTLNGVIEISPNNVAALFTIAEVYQLMGQMGLSEQNFKKVIELSPSHLEARLRLAGIYVETDRLNEGIEALQEIIKLDKESPQAQKAMEILKKLQTAKEQSMSESEKLKLTEERLQQMIAEDPNNINAHFNLGRLYYQLRRLQDARHELEEVVRIAPDNERAQVTLGALYDEMGLYDLAIDRYSTVIALEKDKESADHYEELKELTTAKKLYSEGNLGLAREKFDEIIAKNPDSATAYFYLGLINANEDQLSKSVDDYEEVIRLIPGHVGARLNLALSYERLHREEDAISQYRKILEAGPPVGIAETAEKRMEAAEKRISGLTTGLSYSLTSDSNTNLSNTNPSDDIRSDLSVNIAYQYKLDNGIRLRFSTSPTYSTYHVGQFDFLNTSSSLSATMFPANYTIVGGYTNRISRGLVTANRFSSSQVLFGEGSTRLKIPRIFSPFSGDDVISDFSLNASYTNFESDNSPFFSAHVYTAGFGLNQPFGDNSSINFSYNYTLNENKYDDTLSADYAYKSQGIDAGFEQAFAPGLSANFRYSIDLLNYSNLDSVSQFTEYRKNTRQTFSFGGSYRFSDNIRFYSSLSWTMNKSNLPVGFVLDAQDVIEGQQSSSLGEYDRGTFTIGMNLFI